MRITKIRVTISLIALVAIVSVTYFYLAWLGNRDKSHSNLEEDLQKVKNLSLAVSICHDTRKAFPFSDRLTRHIHKDLSWRMIASDYVEGFSYPPWLYDPDFPWDAPENQEDYEGIKNQFVLSSGNVIGRIKTDVTNFSDIKDGRSKTIMLLENSEVQHPLWKQPNDPTIEEAINMVFKLEMGESLIAASYDFRSFRIGSPLATGVTRDQLRAALDPNDGIEFNLKNLE